MAYNLTREEFHTLLRNTRPGALTCQVSENQEAQETLHAWYNKNGELRYQRLVENDGETITYTVISELTNDEVQEPVPQLRIRVETFEELQEILNNYAKLRKEQENGNQG